MKYLFFCLPLVTLVGCATKQQVLPPPSVSTAQVIESLNDTKDVLSEAGEQNTSVALKIDKALTLAERLDILLEQIEKEAAQQANKNVIKPE